MRAGNRREVRPRRSLLVLPANNERFVGKAAASAADAVLLDLEDAVAEPAKTRARTAAVAALRGLDWGAKHVGVRINALDSPWMYRDLIDLAEHCPRLDFILLPKVASAGDLRVAEVLLTQIEQSFPRPSPVRLEALIETAEGLVAVEEIARASPRLEALHFGNADFAAATRARITGIGASTPRYAVLGGAPGDASRAMHPGDPWHYALARILVACRAAGILALDGPFGDLQDPQGYVAAADRSAALGYDGKWAIHPSQVAFANQAFSPTPEQLLWARRVLAALEAARVAGSAAVALDGQMIDTASLRLAERLAASLPTPAPEPGA